MVRFDAICFYCFGLPPMVAPIHFKEMLHFSVIILKLGNNFLIIYPGCNIYDGIAGMVLI